MTDTDDQNWFLQEWMIHLEKRQASLVNELGWNKSRANMVWHGKQPYSRAMVNELSAWLGIQPFELLMAPDEALRLRQFREAAFAIAANLGAGGGGGAIDTGGPRDPKTTRTPRKDRAA